MAKCHDRPVRAVIVGGGIGGLCTAIGLRRAGHDVLVLERATRLDPVGAGITLFSNAMRGLDRLGMREAVAARGAPASWSAILTSAGAVLAAVPQDLLEGGVAVHRGDLQAVLAEAAGDVRLNAEVTSVSVDGAVRLADGGEERADFVVGADGLRSIVRRGVAEAAPRFAGYTAWRAVADHQVDSGRWTESWGVGRRFGLIDIGGGRTYWFATKNAREGERDEADGRKAEIARTFAGWHDPIAAVIGATPEEAILRNDVYYLDALPRWSDGRVVLLGDAAHTTTPGIGQGAAQAVADAVVLSRALDRGPELSRAFEAYEAERRPLTKTVLKLSRRADRAGQVANPLGWRLRNLLVRTLPASAQRRQLEPVVNAEL
jgi:2-polyprenyl-6-methoxyphenol hydroxylase-like FAD-dependent oxidoreductase